MLNPTERAQKAWEIAEGWRKADARKRQQRKEVQMGWSCTKSAGIAMDVWEALCRAQTGTSNTYSANGKKYFFEVGDEQADGAIVGKVYQLIGEMASGCGYFRIEPNGMVARWPVGMKKALDQAVGSPVIAVLSGKEIV